MQQSWLIEKRNAIPVGLDEILHVLVVYVRLLPCFSQKFNADVVGNKGKSYSLICFQKQLNRHHMVLPNQYKHFPVYIQLLSLLNGNGHSGQKMTNYLTDGFHNTHPTACAIQQPVPVMSCASCLFAKHITFGISDNSEVGRKQRYNKTCELLGDAPAVMKMKFLQQVAFCTSFIICLYKFYICCVLRRRVCARLCGCVGVAGVTSNGIGNGRKETTWDLREFRDVRRRQQQEADRIDIRRRLRRKNSRYTYQPGFHPERKIKVCAAQQNRKKKPFTL